LTHKETEPRLLEDAACSTAKKMLPRGLPWDFLAVAFAYGEGGKFIVGWLQLLHIFSEVFILESGNFEEEEV
jgi:hypothetical protein